MKLDALKKQAGRLAAYLGAKHRVNLKHAAALEAIAAVYGARNWQTLSAQSERGIEPGEDSSATRPGAQRGSSRPITWATDGAPMMMPSADLSRHVLAHGEVPVLRAWFEQHGEYCLQQGQPGLFIDFPWAGDSAMPTSFVEERGLFLDMRGRLQPKTRASGATRRAVEVNLLAGCDAAQAWEIVSAFANERLRGHCILQMRNALETIVEGLTAAGRTVTASAIGACLGAPEKLAKLRDDATEPAKGKLEHLLQRSVTGLDPFDSTRELLSIVQEKMLEASVKGLFSSEPDAVSAYDMLANDGVVVVHFPDTFADRAVAYLLWNAVATNVARRRYALPERASRSVMVYAVPDLRAAVGSPLKHLLDQGRGVGIAVLLGNPERNSPAPRHVEANVMSQVYLGDQKKAVEAEVLRRLASASSVVMTSDTVRF